MYGQNRDDSSSFESLVANVDKIHSITSGAAKGAVNQLLTIRNWAIGYYIVEFEQNGKDRAGYGSHLLTNLAKKLSIKGLDRTVLNLCRIFHRKYPHICDLVNHRLSAIEGAEKFLAMPVNNINDQEICDSANHKFETPSD